MRETTQYSSETVLENDPDKVDKDFGRNLPKQKGMPVPENDPDLLKHKMVKKYGVEISPDNDFETLRKFMDAHLRVVHQDILSRYPSIEAYIADLTENDRRNLESLHGQDDQDTQNPLAA